MVSPVVDELVDVRRHGRRNDTGGPTRLNTARGQAAGSVAADRGYGAARWRSAVAVVPAAGMGTRFLPATKAVPKELLPIGDTPTLQLIIDEALGAGIDHIVVVGVVEGKPAIEAYFDQSPEVIEALEAQGRFDDRRARAQHRHGLAGDVRATRTTAWPRSRRRMRRRGGRRRTVRGAAARRVDGHSSLLAQMNGVCLSSGGSVVGLKQVPRRRSVRTASSTRRAGRRRRRRRHPRDGREARPSPMRPAT